MDRQHVREACGKKEESHLHRAGLIGEIDESKRGEPGGTTCHECTASLVSGQKSGLKGTTQVRTHHRYVEAHTVMTLSSASEP